jgi:hypothetical protein
MHTPLPFGVHMAFARRLTPLALVVLLAASCGDNDKGSSATPATTAETTTVSTGPSGNTPLPATPSTTASGLFVGKRDLYPLLAGSLARYVSQKVTGNSVKVVQVAGINSFWAGRSKSQRILVSIELNGQDPPKLEEGKQVSFVGRLKQAPNQGASQLGVKGKTGQPMLQTQGAFVVIRVGDLKLH